MKLNRCFTVKKGFVRAVSYEFNEIGVIVYTDECTPNKKLKTAEKKEIVINWLKSLGFNVSGDTL